MVQNISSKTNRNINFKANTPSKVLSEAIIREQLETFSDRSIRLIKKTSDLIENTWISIRKNKEAIKTPEYVFSDYHKNVSLRPVYANRNNPQMVLKLEEKDGSMFENIIIDRNAKNYIYEKVVKTDKGSATVKSVNTKLKKDSAYNLLVNKYLEKYLPKILSRYYKYSFN